MAEFGIRRPKGCSRYEGGERRKRARKDNCISARYICIRPEGAGLTYSNIAIRPV
jgi:hypothetical protein